MKQVKQAVKNAQQANIIQIQEEQQHVMLIVPQDNVLIKEHVHVLGYMI